MPLLLPGLLSQWQEYVSTQIRSSSAPRWCVLARWSVGIALARCCDWPVLWQRQPGLAVQPDPVRTVARCDNHNGARCDWRRLFRAGAVHSSRHPPVTARQHGRWMPRRQGSAASLRIIRGVPLRLRPPVRPKGRADPGQRRPAIAAGHAVRSSARRELLSRNRLFGKRLRSFARFGLQHAQTPPSPLVEEGGRGDEGQKRAGMQQTAHRAQERCLESARGGRGGSLSNYSAIARAGGLCLT